MSDETAQPFGYEAYASRTRGWEEGEDDARSACPFDTLGYTRDTMDVTKGCDEEILS